MYNKRLNHLPEATPLSEGLRGLHVFIGGTKHLNSYWAYENGDEREREKFWSHLIIIINFRSKSDFTTFTVLLRIFLVNITFNVKC